MTREGNIVRWYGPGEAVPDVLRRLPRLHAEITFALPYMVEVTISHDNQDLLVRRVDVPRTNSRGEQDAAIRREVRRLLCDDADVAAILLSVDP